MNNSLVIPLSVIGVAFIVLGAIMGVVYLSGSPVISPQPPPNLAPLESPTPYAVGDLLQSENRSDVVVVTGYDADHGFYSYQPVIVNFTTGGIRIMEGTSTMSSREFEVRYPYRMYADT